MLLMFMLDCRNLFHRSSSPLPKANRNIILLHILQAGAQFSFLIVCTINIAPHHDILPEKKHKQKKKYVRHQRARCVNIVGDIWETCAVQSWYVSEKYV